MKLNTKIGDHIFKLNIGNGYNDWVWLGHYAARQYSKVAYPQGVYLPTQLSIQDQEHNDHYPHPRQKIKFFLQQNKLTPQNISINVKIRKGNHSFTQYEKIWQKQAYGIQRYLMNVFYVMDLNIQPNKPNEKFFYYKVHIHYTMHNDVRHLFDQKKYPPNIQLQLEEKAISSKSCTFKGSIRLPFGTVSHDLYYHKRDPKIKQIDTRFKEDSSKINVIINPKFLSIEETNSLIAEQMKISDNIGKAIQQKQLQAKKRNANSSLCCFTFEQLWKILQDQYSNQLCLSDYQNSTIQRIKVVLQKSLNSLYQIFFYYFIIQNQQKQKKQQLGITYQHVMHFLHYYHVFADMQSLQGFLQFYNSDFKFKNIKQTVDIQNKSVRFPQFITILLRAIQFLQTTIYSVKGQTFDVSVIKIIDKIQQIDSEQEEFGQFKRNLRQNPKIISFIRNNSESLKGIFVDQAIRSIQNSADNYIIMKEQFKEMLQLSGLTNKNTNTIVQDLFQQLNFSQQGIFYYEFIEAVQWLSLAIVSSDKESVGLIQNQQQQAMLIIEKIKFFIEKIQL